MTRDEAERIIYGLDDDAEYLTAWEAEYLDVRLKKLDDPAWVPSTHEEAKLKQIYRERVSSL